LKNELGGQITNSSNVVAASNVSYDVSEATLLT